MTTAQQTAWPEGVIARYVTVAGATVELTTRLTLPPSPEPFATLAACTACPNRKEFSHYRTHYPAGGFLSEAIEEHVADAAENSAREWAQAHAERCRAMTRPEGN